MSFILPSNQWPRRFALTGFATPLLLAALLFVGACATVPLGGGAPETVSVPADTSAAPSATSTSIAYALLQQAETAVSPARESLLLQAADIYQQQGDNERLGRVLQEIKPANVSGDAVLHYSLLYGNWALSRYMLANAAEVLRNPQLDALADNTALAQLHGLRARLYEQEQKPLDALNERLLQSLLVSSEPEQKQVSNAIWQLLSQLRSEEFSFLEYADTSNKTEEQLLAGWLALARIQRQSGDIDKQLGALNDWQRSWPLHPANRFMPVDMAMLKNLKDDQPHQITLLLPLTGKRADAGQAVRDGFLAAHFMRMANGNADTRIDVIDSNASPDILTAYNSAVAQGAQLIVGPLEREQVQQLASQPSLPVPTLAMNTTTISSTTAPGRTPEGLYQFSLNPEEDVVQVANMASAGHMRRALVVAPQGERGERLVQAFTRRWEVLGGSQPKPMRYPAGSGNYSVQLADALGIDLASGQLRSGNTLPDMVFFIGNSADAAVIIDALAASGAGTVPVYATAQSFTQQPALALRLEGLRLCLSPWQAGLGPLRAAGDAAPAGADILYAMGADALTLYPDLPMMQVNTSLNIAGNTGYLSMDADRRVVRQLIQGVMRGGQFQAIPVTASERF